MTNSTLLDMFYDFLELPRDTPDVSLQMVDTGEDWVTIPSRNITKFPSKFFCWVGSNYNICI
jgi:hypothetical protein